MNKMILDCGNLCHIAYHSLPEMNRFEKSTAVIFGFMNLLFSYQERFKPRDLIFCWDSRKSYRKIICPTYKLRPESTDEEKEEKQVLYDQMDEIRTKVLPFLGFKNNFMKTGYEADDLIAHIVRNYDDQYIIVSTDQDLYQLLSEDVCIYSPVKKVIISEKAFIDDYGVLPNQWSMVKALGGCSSDNVIGIKGVGEKTAIKYINGILPTHHKSYVSITSDEGQKTKRKNYRLTNLPFVNVNKLDIELFSQPPLDDASFINFFEEYGFNSFLSNIEQWKYTFNLLNGDIPF